MDQLSLFATPRSRPGARGGPIEHYTTTGIGAAGWPGGGQFYWDLRRWLQGLDPVIVDEPSRPRTAELFELTTDQVAYFDQGGR